MVFVHHTTDAPEQFGRYCRKLDDYSAKKRPAFRPSPRLAPLFRRRGVPLPAPLAARCASFRLPSSFRPPFPFPYIYNIGRRFARRRACNRGGRCGWRACGRGRGARWRPPLRGERAHDKAPPRRRRGGGELFRLFGREGCLRGGNYFREARYTISTAMSAGLTPEMRPACPRLSGRILFSFCRASRRSPPICS